MIDDEILHKWIDGSISEEELAQFKRRPEFESLNRLFKQTEVMATPEFDDEAMLRRILDTRKATKTISDNRKKNSVLLSPWFRYGIAACILIIGGFIFWPTNENPIIISQVGEQKSGRLPDGSVYTLNANSQISYSRKGYKTSRKVTLMGEAFFNVKEGESFVLQTDQGSVSVLGTEFNVISRESQFDVACTEGMVEVKFVGKREVVALSAGDACRLSSSGRIELRDSKGSTSWLNGITKLKDVPLSIALESLENQFEIVIELENIDINDLISVNFPHDNLDQALMSITVPLGLSYSVDDNNQVTISK